MSHFTVAVITKTTAREELEKLLQPFHEFECTGKCDEFVIDVDITDEAWEQYNKRTTTMLKDAKGFLHNQYLPSGEYDPRFYREPTLEEIDKHGIGDPRQLFGTGVGGGITWVAKDWGDGKGYRAKVYQIPEGWQEVELPVKKLEGFATWASGWYGYKIVPFDQVPDVDRTHKHGYILLSGDASGQGVSKVIRRTNPNAKWDWWVVGGRWTGRWKEGFNPDLDPNNYESCMYCSCTGSRKGSEGLLLTDEKYVRNTPYKVKEGATGCNVCLGTGYARKFSAHHEAVSEDTLPCPMVPRDKGTFAILTPDGEWHARGEMGWWGVVFPNEGETAEVTQEKWDAYFAAILDKHTECFATIVDCHI